MQENYKNTSTPQVLGDGGVIELEVYNDSGSTISAGALKVASPKWISGKGVVMAMTAIASNATETNWIGIVMTDIADGAYGRLRIKGPYGSLATGIGAATTGTVAANDQLKTVNATTTLSAVSTGATVGGGVLSTLAVAIAIELVTTNVWAVYLIGKQSSIA